MHIPKQLRKYIELLHREKASIGSGSTADAVRFEKATGQPIKDRIHKQKAQDYSKALRKWLRDNPTARAQDRAVAENILLDMNDALGEKAWYSATMTPK